MKAIKITSTAILFLLLGIAAPAYAQHGQDGDKQDRHEQQQGKHEQGRPEAQHDRQSDQGHGQPQHAQQQQGQHQQQPQHAQQQQRPHQNNPQAHAQRRPGNVHQRNQERHRVRQAAWQQHRARSWESDHRTWLQRGGYHGYRIPDDRYRGYFGPNHGFRVYGRPFLVVGGFPRFQYNGYWLSMVDPWPETWANNWYDTDDVYVNYVDNGYYLYNRTHPGVGIAISISM